MTSQAEYQKRWREANRDMVHKRQRKWAAANREKVCEKNRKRYAAKREQILRQQLQYRSSNPNRVRETTHKWNAAHPDKIRANDRKRRAQLANCKGSYTDGEFLALCEKYDNRCLCCGKNKPLTADHVIPINLCGADTIENIQPLCGPCNSRKGTKTTDYRYP